MLEELSPSIDWVGCLTGRHGCTRFDDASDNRLQGTLLAALHMVIKLRSGDVVTFPGHAHVCGQSRIVGDAAGDEVEDVAVATEGVSRGSEARVDGFGALVWYDQRKSTGRRTPALVGRSYCTRTYRHCCFLYLEVGALTSTRLNQELSKPSRSLPVIRVIRSDRRGTRGGIDETDGAEGSGRGWGKVRAEVFEDSF